MAKRTRNKWTSEQIQHAAALAHQIAEAQRPTDQETPGAQQKPRHPMTAAQVRRQPRQQWTVYRLRRQLLPHAVAAALIALGFAAEAVEALTGAQLVVVAAVVAIAYGPIALIAAMARSRIPAAWRRRLTICGLTGATWLTIASVSGVTWTLVAALLVTEYSLAARWWQHVRIDYPTAKPTRPDIDDAVAAAGTSIPELWAAHVGNTNGVLPGSMLLGRERTQYGEHYTAQLARGKHTLQDVLNALPKIASGLDRPMDELVAESHPSGRPSQVLFKAVIQSPIKGNVTFDKPRYRKGIIELGPYADGQGEAEYRLYTPGSMWSGIIIGGTGIGKSRVVENIAINAMSSGHTAVWFLDPQNGVSSPALRDHADWFVNLDGADKMLRALKNIVYWRGEESAAFDLTGFTPSADRPGLLVVVEECHKVFINQAIGDEWAGIAREARKIGVALLCVSQYPGLITFGGSEPLRSSIMEGNAIALRTTSNTAGQLMAGLEVNPLHLPKIAGYGYTMDTGNGRTAPFRNRLIGDKDLADEQRTTLTGEWMAIQPRTTLDPFARNVAGDAYVRRNTSPTEVRAASRARVEAIRAGTLSVTEAPTRTTPTNRAADEDLAGARILAMVPSAIGGDEPAHEFTPGQAAVYDAIAEGAEKPADIQQLTGYGKSRVHTLLAELQDSGHVVKTTYGRYALSTDLDRPA